MNKLLLKSIVFFSLLAIQAQVLFAQDFITLKDGETLTITIVRMDSVKVYFKQFDSSDTVQYFLQKENITALVFASNNFKRIKDISFKNGPIYKSVNQIISPDYIYPVGGEMIKAFIYRVSENQIQFRIAYANDTNMYFLQKAEINEITFNEIATEQKREEGLSDMEIASKARADAYQNYDGYKPAAVGSFAAGIFCWYLIPIVIPVLLSVIPPQESGLGMPNLKLKQNPIYSDTYIKTAHTIKSSKVWTNFGYGALTSIGVIVFLVYLAFLSY